MDFFGAIVNVLFTTVAYTVIAIGVYKLFQIATDIREIKDHVIGARRVAPSASPFTPVSTPALAPDVAKDLAGEDSAAAYAEHLLRAVNAESQRSEKAPSEVR